MGEIMEIVKIRKGESGRNCVSARELYKALDLAESQFSRWAALNILENVFAVKNEDYQGFDIMSSGNLVRDYALSLDFAKRLCMLSRTEKGEEVRKYFIECEKQFQFQIPKTYSEALMLAARQAAKIEEQEKELIEQKPKVEFYNQIIDSDTAINMQEVAGLLNIKGLGRNNLFEFLRKIEVLNRKNIPYREYIESGYFALKERPVLINGKEEIKIITLVYNKGIEYIRKKVDEKWKKTEKIA